MIPLATARRWSMPPSMKLTLILGALIWIFAVIGVRSLFSQVTAVAELRDGVATLVVGNPTSGPLSVTVSLFRDATSNGGAVALGDSVDALISPASFTLQPGELQVVRVRVNAPVRPGELLRVVTVLDPAPPTGQGIHLVTQLRMITKMRVVP